MIERGYGTRSLTMIRGRHPSWTESASNLTFLTFSTAPNKYPVWAELTYSRELLGRNITTKGPSPSRNVDANTTTYVENLDFRFSLTGALCFGERSHILL